MSPEERRAHLALHDQPLLDAFDESVRLRREGRNIEAAILWRSAIAVEYGAGAARDATMHEDWSCTLANGHHYQPNEFGAKL